MDDIARLGLEIRSDGVVVAGKRLRDTEKAILGTDRAASTLATTFRVLGPLMTAVLGAFGIRNLIEMTSAWTDLNSRVGIAVGNMDAAGTVMARLSDMARRTYSPLVQTAETFLGNATALRELGYSTNQTLDYVEAINNALVVSGAKGQRAESVMNALNKAMGLGKLAGENLNTVLASGGRITEVLAAHMGVSTNELRKLGAEGKLTSDVIYKSLVGALEELREQADSMPATINDAFVLMGNSILGFVGRMDEATGASAKLAEAIIAASDWLDDMGSRVIPYVVAGLDLFYAHLDDLYDLFQVFVAAKLISFLWAMTGAFLQTAKAIRAAGLVMVAVNLITKAKITTIALLAALLAKATNQWDSFTKAVSDTAQALYKMLPPEITSAVDDLSGKLFSLDGELRDVSNATGGMWNSFLNIQRDGPAAFGEVDRSAKGASSAVGAMGEKLIAANDNAREFFDTMERGVAGGLSGIIKAAVKGESVLDSLTSAVGRLGDSLIDMAMNQMIQGLFSTLFGGMMGGGSWNIPKSFVPGGFYPGLASGGTVTGAGMTWVGEQGPELLRLPKGAQVIPHKQSVEAANGRGVTVNVPISINGNADAMTLRDLRAWARTDLARLVRQAVNDPHASTLDA